MDPGSLYLRLRSPRTPREVVRAELRERDEYIIISYKVYTVKKCPVKFRDSGKIIGKFSLSSLKKIRGICYKEIRYKRIKKIKKFYQI